MHMFHAAFITAGVGILNPGFEEREKVNPLAFQNELKPVAQHWYKIGKQLQISESTLETIRTVHWRSYETCLGELGINWLKKERNATWGKLVKALRSENLAHLTGGVADDLQKKYCPKPSSMSSATSAKSYTMVGIGEITVVLSNYLSTLSSYAAIGLMMKEGSGATIVLLHYPHPMHNSIFIVVCI